jgi:Holliday junction resolvase-like predicted endonuclease
VNFVYTARDTVSYYGTPMPIVSRLIFQAVHWAARKGLRDADTPSPETKKYTARRTGIRGETYAYWYLRRHGYIFVARNFTPRASKGEIDMVGYDGNTLAFVEVRTRTVRDEMSALPELSVTPGKQHLLARTARIPWRSAASANVRAGLTSSPSTIPPASRLFYACIKTPLAPKCKIPQEKPRNAFSAEPDAVQLEPRGSRRAKFFAPCRGGLLCRSCEKTRLLAAG